MIGELLRRAVQENPDHLFLVTPTIRYSYGEASARVLELRSWLGQIRASRYLIYMSDCPDLILLLIASSLEGCQASVANRRYRRDELIDLCRRFRFDHLVTDMPLDIRELTCHEVPGSSDSHQTPDDLSWMEDNPDARHMVLTTGTTGEPKAALYRWPDLSRQIRINPAHQAGIFLLAYQLNHFAGIQVMIHILANRATLVIPGSLQMTDAFQAIKQFGVTHISATPTFWRMLCAWVGDGSSDIPLKQITLGGEAVTEKVLSKLSTCFPGVPVSQVYASTEMGSCFSVRDGEIGFPISLLDREDEEVQLRIIDDELYVRSSRSMLGYYDSVEKAPCEWFPTGDLVAIKGERILFLGRKSETINVGGVKVHPSEIEKVIEEVDGVISVRVLGRPNPITGKIVVAEVVPVPGYDHKEMESNIRRSCQVLDRYQRPRIIEFSDQLPTANQKLLRTIEDSNE